jgi:hypothetical protein
MPRITHVILSDLHLGAETSLLTELDAQGKPAYRSPSPVLKALAEGLHDLLPPRSGVGKPQLILAGDTLELALAETHEAAMCFEQFLLALFPSGGEEDIFDREIIYIPGNHDHRLWTTVRAEHYADYVAAVGGSDLGEPWHVTRMYENRAALVPWPHSRLLDALAKRHQAATQRAEPVEVRIAYPNFGLLSADANRSVIVTHGHFVEPMYQLMTKLHQVFFPDTHPAMRTIAEIEQENAAWIDFFWSTMGRSGMVGENIQRFYEFFSYDEGIDALADRLAKGIEAKALKPVIRLLCKKIAESERGDSAPSLGPCADAGMMDYINGPLAHQVKHERRHAERPEHVTIVFGFSHKPFEERRENSGFAQPVKILNTGGWVVDAVEPHPDHGAAIVFVDESMDCASLRLFDEPGRGSKPQPVRVAAEPGDGVFDNPLADDLRNYLAADPAPWQRFSTVVGTGLELRADALARRPRG